MPPEGPGSAPHTARTTTQTLTLRCTRVHKHTCTHTQAHSVSLSLSHTHTHLLNTQISPLEDAFSPSGVLRPPWEGQTEQVSLRRPGSRRSCRDAVSEQPPWDLFPLSQGRLDLYPIGHVALPTLRQTETKAISHDFFLFLPNNSLQDRKSTRLNSSH